MEVSAVDQPIPIIIDHIHADLELRPEGGSCDLRHVELDVFYSPGLVQVDYLPECVRGQLLQPE